MHYEKYSYIIWRKLKIHNICFFILFYYINMLKLYNLFIYFYVFIIFIWMTFMNVIFCVYHDAKQIIINYK